MDHAPDVFAGYVPIAAVVSYRPPVELRFPLTRSGGRSSRMLSHLAGTLLGPLTAQG